MKIKVIKKYTGLMIQRNKKIKIKTVKKYIKLII